MFLKRYDFLEIINNINNKLPNGLFGLFALFMNSLL